MGAILDDSRLIVTFTDVTREDFEALENADTRQDVRQLLAECMRVDEEDGFHALILIDFHQANYRYCREQHFNAEKTSTFLSIQKVVYEASISQQLPKEVSFDLFRSLVLKHSCQRPPYAIGVFTSAECRMLMEYVRATLFHHYKMYLYAYRSRYEVDIRLKEKRIVPAQIITRPLAEADICDPSTVPELLQLFRRPVAEAQTASDIFAYAQDVHDQATRQGGSVQHTIDSAAAEVLRRAEAGLEAMTNTYVAAAAH